MCIEAYNLIAICFLLSQSRFPWHNYGCKMIYVAIITVKIDLLIAFGSMQRSIYSTSTFESKIQVNIDMITCGRWCNFCNTYKQHANEGQQIYTNYDISMWDWKHKFLRFFKFNTGSRRIGIILVIVRIFVLHLIIINKSEIWISSRCLWLGYTN